ncbi:MAG: putative phage protein [Gammaproteobacteria bacterium]|jgi:hypothetical protein|nr:putative phage protein [Gammaproteobacteria bacterium]
MNKSPAITSLFEDIKQLVEEAKNKIAHHANSTLVILYWHIGNKINNEVLKNERAEYSEQIIHLLSKQLSEQYGNGFDRTNLTRMAKLARFYFDSRIIETLSQQLS